MHLDGGRALRPCVVMHVFRHAHESAGFQKTSTRLVKLVSHPAGKTKLEHASHLCHEVIPAMAAVRKAGDTLEGMVADDLWPLATYQEMLFIM